MLYTVNDSSCPNRRCNKCDYYRKKLEKYKYKYEIAKLGLTREEKTILLDLIQNEQIKHLIAKEAYLTDEYMFLEQLKAKLKVL